MTQRIPSHLLAVLTLGVVSQVGQVLLLRELLMVFHGTELSIGLILAAWLAWVGAGSRLGAVLVDHVNHPRFLLMLSTAGVLLTLPTTILLIRGLRGFFDVLPGAYLSLLDMTISCFLLMAPACLLLGAQFVLLSRIWREGDRAEDTSGAAKTYVGEAAGSLIGGILFTFLMVRYLNSVQSAVLASMLMLIAVLLTTRKLEISSKHLSVRLRLGLLGLLAFAVITFPFLEYIDGWAYQLQWRYLTPQYQLVETQQSKYGAISVVRREDQYSFFQSGHMIFTTAGSEAVTPGLEEQQAATSVHFSMVQHNKPKRILLIGGGLRGTLSEIAKHPVERIDYIELDEVLTKLARPYVSPETLEALTDSRVRLIHTDGRLFVKMSEEKYDMIIVDVPDPATAVLNRYYTQEFFHETETLLNPDGVFVIGTISTPDLRGIAIANRNATIYHTLRSVFSRVLPAGERFMFYFATNASWQVSVDVPTLQERYRERNIETEGFSYQHYHALLPQSQLERVNWIVRNNGRSPDAYLEGPGLVPLFPGTVAEQVRTEEQLPPLERNYFINSDLKPIGYYYTVMFWDDLARTEHRETFKWLLQVKPWWILPLVFFPLLVVLGLRTAASRIRKRPDTHFAVLFTVFTTGLSTMALQIALLFSFQSIYGFVYEMVGLIVAIFMGGLALGTLFTHRYVANKANLHTLANVQLLVALVA
ncbi:spermidine synthase, partial [Chloroflexota bacterium]